MLHGNRHHILIGLQIRLFRHFRHGLGQGAEDVPIRARLPERIHGGLERMDKGMHIRGGEIRLFIPGGRGQNDVGIEGRARHAEIDADEQIQLSLQCAAGHLHFRFVPPLDFLRFFLAFLLGKQTVLRAQKVFQEILMSLGGGSNEIRPPNK